jgi:hypothetical protein
MAELKPRIAISAPKIEIGQYDFIKPLAIGLLAVRAKNRAVELSDFRGSVSTFLSRIGFFDYANLEDPHQIRGFDIARTIEIRAVPQGTDDKVYHSLKRLLSNHEVTLQTISKIVMELVANVEMHSQSSGLIVGQVANNTLRLAIVDDGIGIHKSLTSNPEYQDLTEEIAIRRSLEKGVTVGTGKGFGLWSAYEVLRENGGKLILGSGHFHYSLKADRMLPAPRWAGTYVNIAYDLDKPVDYTEITGKAASFKLVSDEDFGFM